MNNTCMWLVVYYCCILQLHWIGVSYSNICNNVLTLKNIVYKNYTLQEKLLIDFSTRNYKILQK